MREYAGLEIQNQTIQAIADIAFGDKCPGNSGATHRSNFLSDLETDGFERNPIPCELWEKIELKSSIESAYAEEVSDGLHIAPGYKYR